MPWWLAKALLNKTDRSQLEVAKDLYRQTYSVDISNIDNVKRNPRLAQNILQSYSRNLCTLASEKTLVGDVNANFNVTQPTFDDYIQALENLYIIEHIDAWCPAIRSKSAIRASKKRNFIDPSIAVAALGLSPEYFNTDFKTLGFLFESLFTLLKDLFICFRWIC